MQSHRLFWFVVLILVGIGAGLVYGWVINPTRYSDITPDTLREDYQTDYVLMVAEVFQQDGDILAAAQRLAPLGSVPFRQVQEAIVNAQTLGYSTADLERLVSLSQALQFWTPEPKQQSALRQTETTP